MKRNLYFILSLLLLSNVLQAQISSPSADATEVTNYPVFTEPDSIFVFCTNDSTIEVGELVVNTNLQGTKTFLWEKYNEVSASFELFFQESSDGNSSEIQNLGDGCYRSTITLGSTTIVGRAWVLNNWTVVNGFISDSNCESFKLNGRFKTAKLNYYDLASNAKLELPKDVKVEWKVGDSKVSPLLNTQVFDPPKKNTDYQLHVFDKFACEGRTTVTYQSIVTKAKFSVTPMTGEAPLTVTFVNESENGSPGNYEWFLYRDLEEIRREAEATTQTVDSLITMAYDDSPTFTYENSGAYPLKLVSKHVSSEHTCVDTFRLKDLIKVDTSYVVVPNVFTPNGDGVNDVLRIKFWSMQSIEISILNRWGRKVHYWKSGNVLGSDEVRNEAVWDGKIGGNYASPGVYYYDVLGRGRDGRKQEKNGFIHLFRGKN